MTRISQLKISIGIALVSQPALAQFNLRIQQQPPQPTEDTPVIVSVCDDFADTCFSECGASIIGFHVDWHIRDLHAPGVRCSQVITPRCSQPFSLGILAPGDYTVTGTEYISLPNGPCFLVATTHGVQVTFRVYARCDLDRNGVVDTADVSRLVGVLLGTDTNPTHAAASDLNGDGLANGADIAPFVICAAH